MLLGHAHPEVIAAVTAAARRGTSYGAPTVAEVDLAEAIVDRTPVEQVRLVSSGTEATMSALRLARGHHRPGQDHQVRRLLPRPRRRAAGRGRLRRRHASASPGARPGSPGAPRPTADTIVLPYNDRAGVRAAFAAYGDQIACVITEAAAGNMGVVPPGVEDGVGFNAFLADIATRHGALFISDEVMTGFRVSRSGPVRPGRRRAGSDDLRQGDGRRVSRRRRSAVGPS